MSGQYYLPMQPRSTANELMPGVGHTARLSGKLDSSGEMGDSNSGRNW